MTKKYRLGVKLTSALLAFLFIISPLAPIFAAEKIAPANIDSVADASSSDSVTLSLSKGDNSNSNNEDVAIDLAAPEKGNPDNAKNNKDKTKPKDDGLTMSASSLLGGTTGDSVKSQDKARLPQSEAMTGALTYEYPLAVPPGRNNLQPDLKLAYNSQSGDESSYIGYGWSLNIPYIERINRKGTDKLYTENYFYSSLSGELVSLGGTSYGAKIDNGEFLKYEFSSNSWLVTDKQGTKYKFGYSTSTRQDNPADTTKVFKWMLEEIRDTNDNYIKYEYFKDENQIYPSKITYTGSGSTDGIFEVNFLRQTKNSVTSFKSGFSVKTAYRINEINTEINNVWAKKYTLAYTTGDNSGRSILSSIMESGQDETNNTITLPATSFNYKTRGSNWVENSSWQMPYFTSFKEAGSMIIDANGDSFPDLLFSGSNYSTSEQGVYLNNGSGWAKDTSWQIPFSFDQYSHAVDVNGDSLVDLIDFRGNNEYPLGVVYLNVGNGWVVSYSLPDNRPGNVGDPGSQIADVNGDGLPDLVFAVNDPAMRKVFLNNGAGWTVSSSWQIPIAMENSYSRISDVNGDGLADLFVAYWNSSEQKVYLNTGSGWEYDSSWRIPDSFEQGSQLADVNSDGLNDIIQSWPGTQGMVYFNNGNGWTANSSWQLPYDLISGSQIVDVNGDGLIDLLYAWNDVTYPVKKVFLNNGNGRSDLASQITYSQGGATAITYKTTAQYKNGSVLLNPNLPMVLDTVQQITNSDGLGLNSTTAYSYEGGKYYYSDAFNRKFSGFSKVAETDTVGNLTNTYFHQGDSTNSSQGEYSDNSSKIGKVYRTESYDSSGNLYSKTINKWEGADPNFPSTANLVGYWDLDEGTGTAANDSSSAANNGTLTNMDSADWVAGKEGTALDFDGVNDYVDVPHSASLNISDYLTFAAWINPSTIDSVYYIASKRYSWHFYTSLGKLNITLYHNGGNSTTIASSVIPVNAWTLVAFTYSQNDPIREPKLYINGTEVIYESRTAMLFDYSLDTSANNVNIGRHGGGYLNFNGKMDDARIYNRILTPAEIFSLYNNPGVLDRSVSGNERNFLKLTQKIDSNYDGNSTHKDKAETYAYDNTNGNLTEKTQWGEVTGTDTGTFTDTGTDKLTTSISYASNLTTNVIGLPSQEITLDQNSNKIKESKYYYDTLALGSADKGNQTKEEKWKTGTDYINVQKSYNSYGLVTQDTDPRGKITTYTYDSYNLYPVTVTNALSQATQYTYNYSLGKPKQTTDPNGYVSQTVYDGLDRVLEEKQPDLTTPATLVTKSSYVYTDTANAVSVKKTDYLDATFSVDSYSYFDGLGRLIQTRQEAEDTNIFSVKDLVYNNRGLLNKESLLYFSTGTAKTTATTDNTLYSTYAYDTLGRVTSTVNAVGTTTNTYDDWKVTTTDAKGVAKDLYKDAYGNLVQVDEHGSTTLTTSYNYDSLNNLTKITDALGNIRNFTYDGLGQRLTAEDLHASADATFGTWTYTYDASGNLTSQLDPKNQTVNYTYDDLNRQLTEDYTGQVGTEKTYAYDTCTSGIGKLCAIATNDYTEAKEYNALGLTSIETKTIDSVSYPTSYAYDRQGNNILLTNPDNSQVKYIYNTAGQLEQTQRKESTDSNFINVVTDFDYSPMGQPTAVSYANGAETTNSYDNAKLYRLSSKVTSTGAEAFTGYLYKKELTIQNNSASDLVNYQIGPITVDTSDFARFHNDCSDIRFTTDSTGQNEESWPVSYSYWIESGCGTANTKIWVKIDSIAASFAKTIYMHYGKADAPAKSNTDETFDFFDDFTGSSLDTNKWNIDTTVTSHNVANSKLTIDGSADAQWDVLKGIYTKNNFPLQNDFAVEVKDFTWNDSVNSHSIDKVGILLTDGTSSNNPISELFSDSWDGHTGAKYGKIEANAYSSGMDSLPLSGTAQFKITKGSDNNAQIFWDGVSILGPAASATSIQKLYILVNKWDNFPFGSFSMDRILVRKYASSEPMVSIGEEQSNLQNSGVKIQDLAYTYDANGNITRIVDNSATNSKKTVNYTYDSLNRLLTAVSTYAINGQNYSETYAYDAIGNITSKNGVAYAYSSTGKTNPHAVTSIGSTNYTYDDNGNLLSDGTLTNTWNYENRLTQSVIDSTTVEYIYDVSGQRIGYSNGTDVTYYPTKDYNITGEVPTKQIFANDQLVATVKDTGYAAEIYFVHTDHLTGSNVITNGPGTLEELMDYYPYGGIRLDEKAGTFSEQRKYAGHEYDVDTGLSYMNARYYNGKTGRFASQDPAYLAMSDSDSFKLLTYLSNPQNLNSYSYALNNPLVLFDPDGNFPINFQEFRSSINTALTFVKATANNAWNSVKTSYNNASLSSPALGSKEYSQKMDEGVKNGGIYLGTRPSGQDVYFGITPGIIKSGGVKVANGLRLGQNIPSLGKVMENAAGKIKGFNHDGTYHGLDRIISRGVNPQIIAETVKNPLARFAGRFERVGYLSKEAYVVLDKTGQVVTSWTKNEFGSIIKNVLNRITK